MRTLRAGWKRVFPDKNRGIRSEMLEQESLFCQEQEGTLRKKVMI